MARAYLGLGGNLGNRLATLRGAVNALDSLGKVVVITSIYETAPVGYVDQPSFLNLAVVLETPLTAEDLLSRCSRLSARWATSEPSATHHGHSTSTCFCTTLRCATILR